MTRDFARSSPVHAGSASIAVTFTSGWSGLQLGHSAGANVQGLDVLRCWVHGGTTGGQDVVIEVGNSSVGASIRAAVNPQAGAWNLVDVPLSALGTTNVTYLYFFNNTAGSQSTFFVDDLTFTTSGGPTPTPTGSVPGPALSVDAGAGRHRISPYIYGLNFSEHGAFVDEAFALDLRLPVQRWGGNATTRYNWMNDTANHAADWYFENLPKSNVNPAALPDGSTSDRFVEQNVLTGTESLVTLPMIGWTPRDRAVACGFSVAKYGPQQSTDYWQPDCGNGIRPEGTKITGNDPRDTSTPTGPEFVQGWVQHLVDRYGSAAEGGVRFYALDNEPMLWPETHRDVHPQPIGYDELRDRTIAYAAAIKEVDPEARTFGPAEWGWTGYFWSSLDWAGGGAWWNNPPDRLAHGDVPLVEWYLRQLRAYDQTTGVRLLDYLDLHYYPQAAGVTLSPAGDAATQARRLRSTRSLWDPTYVDESWIGEAVQLIPRMREWVADNYPNTGLAIGEYNWGALDHINGALAQADVLGIFGREGLDVATLWAPPAASQPGAFAFRIYRNYDGLGSGFGDIAVGASSSGQETVAIYAAQRETSGELTIVVINKTDRPQTSTISLANFTPAATAAAYRYSTGNATAIVRLPDQAIALGGFANTFPAASITLLVIAPSGLPTTATPSATATHLPPTATASWTHTATRTPTATATRTPTATATRTPTATATKTPTVTATPTRPLTSTRTATATARRKRRPTRTPTVANASAATRTPTPQGTRRYR